MRFPIRIIEELCVCVCNVGRVCTTNWLVNEARFIAGRRGANTSARVKYRGWSPVSDEKNRQKSIFVGVHGSGETTTRTMCTHTVAARPHDVQVNTDLLIFSRHDQPPWRGTTTILFERRVFCGSGFFVTTKIETSTKGKKNRNDRHVSFQIFR